MLMEDLSLLSLKGAERAVVILPEAFNAGWIDIACKIGNFINYSPLYQGR